MTTEELEALLDGADETPSLEFKGPMNWDKSSLVKDILAMANGPDGGVIVIGIEDQTLVRRGLTTAQLTSFNLEIMRDQIAPFADPHVVFKCEIISDRAGLQFAVISVSPFQEMPVICRKDGSDVNAGTVYFRSPARRPQSAAVSNSTDMRTILEAAIARRRRSLRQSGFDTDAVPTYDYDAELGGL